MNTQELDFIQLTYNVLDREAEQKLLPLTQDKGIAVIANRPSQGGSLFRYVNNKPLPNWAGDYGILNWAQFFLRFLISHQAITTVIPATSKVSHMIENMGSASGFPLPTQQLRRRMLHYLQAV